MRKYDDLRNSPGAYATELYEQAGYGMGYTFFKMKQYDEAATSFRRFVAGKQGESRAARRCHAADRRLLLRDEGQRAGDQVVRRCHAHRRHRTATTPSTRRVCAKACNASSTRRSPR